MPFLTQLGLEPAASELQDHSPEYKATAAPTVCIMHCIIYYRILYYSPHWFAFSADLVLDGTHFEDIVVTGVMWNTDNTSRPICMKMREIIIEQVEWWFEICKTSGRRSFTQLSCLYAAGILSRSGLSWFFLGLCLINPSISLLCPTNPASVKPPFIFSPFLPTSCPYSRLSPSLFLIDSSRVGESSTSISNGKGTRSFATKFQTFSAQSLLDNLSAGEPRRRHRFILLCNWCPSVSSVPAI